ncbi:MAG: hypothetical protein CVU89_06290 [Firmicutes bacterium HGW-Firmicutes-14]|jgi:nitroreductase|nr:MAG: hypothetical protein CVU89_06290 [Firmicutes bacterium HGW-Firmicutes-14]
MTFSRKLKNENELISTASRKLKGGIMDIFDVIQQRRSVRNYNEQKVSKQDINKLIEAAQWAPSACNKQAWRFIVLDDKDILKKIIDIGAATFLKKTQQAILVLYENQTDNLEYMDYIQSASAAIQNMMLKAHSMGIGTCWICHLPPKRYLRKLLKIPSNYDPIALISIGYPLKGSVPVSRKAESQDIICYNMFNFTEERSSIIKRCRLTLKRRLRYLYFRLPYKGILRKIAMRFEKTFDN